MNVEEFNYPHTTTARALLESFLNNYLPDYTIPIHGHSYDVALCDEPHPRLGEVINLRCVLVAHPVIIQIETHCIEKCFPDGMSFDNFNQLPEDLQMACLHIVFDDTFAQLSHTLGDNCVLQKLEQEPPAAGGENIAFSLNSDGSVIRGVIYLSSDAIAWFAELCQQQELEMQRSNPPDDLPVLLRMELAQTSLLASQLHSLAPDDVVLFPLNSWPEGPVIVRVGDTCFGAQLDEENGLSIQAQWHNAGPEENLEAAGSTEEEPPLEQTDATSDGEELPFVVRFEFPPQKIKLRDLQRLSLRKPVAIAPAAPELVLAYVGDQVIAECELVAIQNRHGARILSLQQHAAAEEPDHA